MQILGTNAVHRREENDELGALEALKTLDKEASEYKQVRHVAKNWSLLDFRARTSIRLGLTSRFLLACSSTVTASHCTSSSNPSTKRSKPRSMLRPGIPQGRNRAKI